MILSSFIIVLFFYLKSGFSLLFVVWGLWLFLVLNQATSQQNHKPVDAAKSFPFATSSFFT